MRLLVVGISWPIETFLMRLFEGLSFQGIKLIFASKQKLNTEWLHQNHVQWIPLWSAAWRARLGRAWDAIYFPWNSAAIENLKLFDQGIPAVVSCRGSQINIAPHNSMRSQMKEGLRTTFYKAAWVHCVSQAIQNEAMQYGLKLEKSRVIYPAVDTNFFFPVEPKSKGAILKIVTIGNLGWVKGHEYALLAIRKLLDDKIAVRYEIVGDGPDRQRILYTIDDLGLQKHVVLHDRLSSEKVRDRLQESDVFLLSSLSEGISNAALEAMACGLPIITTDCGGMREAITDGVEGFVVPVRDPAAMALGLKKLTVTSDLRAQMGRMARRKAQRDFDTKRQIIEFLSLFQEVCIRK